MKVQGFSLGKAFNDLPPVAKGIIAVVMVGGVALAAWKTYKYLSDAKQRRLQKSEEKEGRQDLKELIRQGVVPSYPDSQYAAWANQLKESFDGCGTANEQVANIFARMKNDADVLKLNQAYGIREHDNCNWEFKFDDFKGTLPQAIVNELRPEQIAALNKLLSLKNIKYRY
jgi:hypothetical protein